MPKGKGTYGSKKGRPKKKKDGVPRDSKTKESVDVKYQWITKSNTSNYKLLKNLETIWLYLENTAFLQL